MSRSGRALGALVVAATVALLALPAAARVAHGSSAATEDTGRRLADKFIVLVEHQDVPGLRRFLSPAFQLQRADGSFSNRAEYLRAPAVVQSHHIDNVRATRDGNVLVVRFDLTVEATIDGRRQSTAPAPRLATFRKGPDGWRLTSYANFNAPAAEDPQ